MSQVDEDANLEVDMLIGFLPESMQEVAHDLIEKCAHIGGSDPCDKIYNMAKCVQDKRPDVSAYFINYVCVCWFLFFNFYFYYL